MKYLFVGAGAMGCVLAGHMMRAGKDVTLIARGASLQALQSEGLKFSTPDVAPVVLPIKAVAEADYHDVPDVVIIAIKAYSLDAIIPLLDRICGSSTIILPLLNAIQIGDKIANALTAKPVVLEGVAYVACERLGPAEVRQKLGFFDIVYGMRRGHSPIAELKEIQQDIVDSGATATISDDMFQSALRKFVRVSAASAVLVYYDGTVGDIVAVPERMEMLEALCQEIVDIAKASGCPFPPEDDAVADTLESARTIFPGYRTSLKTDFDAGLPIESQTQFMDVYELGRSLGLEMPAYAKVVRKCGYETI